MATYTSNYGWTKPSGSDNVDISVLNDNLDDQDSTIHDAFLNMAPPFSESSTYAVDDIVLYGKGLYKCHTAVVTPGSWTGSTNWQVYKLSEGGSGGGGTSNYNDLTNKPSINGVTLSGNKTTGDLGLQDELTFDNVPTNGSNNPVKSDGVYDSEKDIYAVMGQMGAKNLNSYPYADTTKTTNGITFTDNGDGTVTANGTATADVYFSCHLRTQGESNDLIIPNGSYTLSGCPSGGGSSTYALSAFRTHNGSADLLGRDNGNGTSVVANGDDFSANEVNLQINILVKNGQTVSNLTFKPMLRLAADTDGTYQPYAKTNRELTESYPANKVMMSDGVTSVEEIVEDKMGNVRMGELWKNPSPSTAFGAQDITLSSDDYTLLLWVYKVNNNTSVNRCVSRTTLKGHGITLDLAEYANGASNRLRTASYVSDTKYAVGAGNLNGANDNTICIPLVVYGIKLT